MSRLFEQTASYKQKVLSNQSKFKHYSQNVQAQQNGRGGGQMRAEYGPSLLSQSNAGGKKENGGEVSKNKKGEGVKQVTSNGKVIQQ
jgi:hypothetical protein